MTPSPPLLPPLTTERTAAALVLMVWYGMAGMCITVLLCGTDCDNMLHVDMEWRRGPAASKPKGHTEWKTGPANTEMQRAMVLLRPIR